MDAFQTVLPIVAKTVPGSIKNFLEDPGQSLYHAQILGNVELESYDTLVNRLVNFMAEQGAGAVWVIRNHDDVPPKVLEKFQELEFIK